MPNNINALHLPEDLIWVDEFQTTQVAQSVKRTLTGAFIVQAATMIAGRQMSLDGSEGGWITRTQLEALRGLLEAAPNGQFTLNYRGIDYTVIQNATAGPALTSQQIVDYATPDSDDWYSIVLNFYII